MTTFKKLSNLSDRFETAHDLVTHQWQRFFQSYAMAFNKQQGRTGTLFQTPFKRCSVDSDEKWMRLILYHHLNPQKHRLCNDFKEYRWTSYQAYLSEKATKLPRQAVLDLFGGREEFMRWHKFVQDDLEGDWLMED